MKMRPPRSKRTNTLLPDTTRFRSAGLLQYCGAETVSWHDFAQGIFHGASTLDDSFCMPQVQAIATVAYPSLAARPAYSALSCAGIEALGIRRQHMRDALPKVLERLLIA